MIHKNAKYGEVKNVDIVEFGNGTIQIGSGGVKGHHQALYMKEDTKHPIGAIHGDSSVSEMKPELIIVFNNRESFLVFYEHVESIRKEFETENITNKEEK